MNMEQPLFKGNLKLRQAINYAVSRREYVAQAGPYAGDPWTHLFNPGVPGWKNVNPYPIDPDLAKARELAAGHFSDGKINVLYQSSGTTNPAQAAIVRQDLINLGFEPANIKMLPLLRATSTNPWEGEGIRSTSVSRWVGVPTIRTRSTGSTSCSTAASSRPRTTSTTRTWTSRWNRKMEAAAKLVGPKRFKVYGQMDLDLMRQVAPIAVERTYNNRYFFSDRVDPKSLVYQGDLPGLEHPGARAEVGSAHAPGVDVGNTQTVLGLFDGERLTEQRRLATEASRTGDELGALLGEMLDLESVDGICLSSTVPALVREFELFAERWAKAPILVVGPGREDRDPVRYDDPREVGPDRMVNAVAARERYGAPCIVVDFGTSTNFDVVSPRASTWAACSRPGSRSRWRRSSRAPRD